MTESEELSMGIEVEKEHEATYNWILDYIMKNKDFPSLEEMAEHIAKDHLEEHKDYYTILKKVKL